MSEIKYVKVRDTRQAGRFVAERLLRRLQSGMKVFWLIPGGSAAEVAMEAAAIIDGSGLGDLLTVSLTDERFGPDGHDDSNWHQLQEKGFKLTGAQFRPILSGQSLESTALSYGRMLDSELSSTGYSLALGGMGADGHIFGLKPNSPSVQSRDMAEGYPWDDFERLTATGETVKRLDEIIMYVVGADKHRQLERLGQDLGPGEQPAQLLKTAKRVTILNDWKGENYETDS